MEEQQRQAFIAYLTANNYAENTVYGYSRGIDRISRHISEQRSDTVSLYNINIARDLDRLKRIRDSFGLQGNFSEIGNEGNGTIRNSINRFVEFREREYNLEDGRLLVVEEEGMIADVREVSDQVPAKEEEETTEDLEETIETEVPEEVENEGQEIGVPVTSTPRRIMAYEDFNELKQMVESLKSKVQETNSTTKLMKTVVVFQVITLILVLYTLLQS